MADVPGKFYRATKVRTGVAPSSAGSIEGEVLPPVNPPGSSLNSVGLTMPSAFTVSNSPLTANGTIGVAGAGTVAQYIRGDGSLADFPESSGGGSSVSYYLNGSVDQGTIGGIAYKELSKVPILGAGTDFTINADGYIASFITDAGDPSLLEIPGGNWNFETYFSASSGGGSPTFYVELYKVSGTTATLIASSSSSPELIAFGTNLTPYFSTLAVPTTTLALTDRLAVRYYVTHSGRTITLHTENNHLCQIITTFTTGLTALNGLTAQVQNFAVGTTGTDFNIASATATHTFNLPTASATNRGALSSADWSLFTQAYNDKINSAAVTGTTTKTLTLTQQDGGTITASWSDLNTDAVLSVFGRTGAVVAANGDYTTAQVTESGNLYYTDARSRAALSFAAGSGAYNTSTGVITIPTNNNQITNGAGYITSAALAGYVQGSGSAGQVAYWSSGSAITGESALFWDATNNRLGIDNASPDAPIHANGGASMTAGWNRTATLQAQYPVLVYNSNGSKWAGIGYDHTAGLRIWVNASSSDVSSGTNALFINNIGAATFISSITASSIIRSGGTSSQYLMADGSVSTLTNPVTGTGVNGRVAIWNGSSTITTDGDLLFSGTELNVSGIKIDGSSVPYIVSTLAGNDLNIQFPVGQGLNLGNNAGEGVARIIKNNITLYNGASTIQTSTGNLTISTGGGNGNIILTPNGTGTTTINSNVTASSFIRSGGTSSQYLMADGSVSTLSNPVTGTGTTNYLPKFTGSTTIGNSIIQDAGTRIDVAGVLRLTPSSTTDIQAYTGSAYSNLFYDAASHNWQTSGGTAKMTLTASGNLLIGTISDNGARLQVSGTGTFTGTGLLASVRINNTTASTGKDWHLYSLNNGNFGLYNNTDGSYAYQVTPSGNVGIGTTTVASAVSGSARVLAIVDNATANVGSVRVYGGGTATSLELYGGGSLVGLFGSTNHPMTFSTNSVEAMRIFSGQNVHIGPTPVSDNGARLQVSGLAAFSTNVTAGGVITSTAGVTMSGSWVRNMLLQSAYPVQVFESNAGGTSRFGAIGYDRTGGMAFWVNSTTVDVTSNNNVFYLANSGAATFSSSVNVGGVSSNTDFRIYRTVAPSVFFSISAPGGTPNTSTLGVNGTDVMYLNASGNVLIGTQTDNGLGARLQVRDLVTITGFATPGLSVRNESNVFAQLGVGVSAGFVGTSSNHQLNFTANSVVLATLKTNGEFQTNAISTSSPVGGTAAIWKLGKVATVSPTSPNRTIEVEVAGTTYYLHAKTTNN